MNNSYLKTLTSLLFFFSVGTQNPHAQSLLFEVSGPDSEHPSYLFGTMHTTNKKVYNLSDEVFTAIESTDRFAGELNFDSLNPMELMSKLTMENQLTLDSLVNDEEFRMINMFFKDSLNVPLGMLKNLQPMFLTALITEKKLQGNADSLPLDLWLAEKAKASGVSVIGLETIDEQLNTFETISYEQQAEMLVNSVKEYDKSDETTQLMNAYLKADLAELLRLSKETEGYPDSFEKTFLTARNKNMFDRSSALITSGKSLFIAVGAAHLGGENGLVQLFKNKGYSVEPLPYAEE